MNHYDVLQVSPAASAEVIRAAYRSLMQRYHPDRHPGDAQASAMTARITQAYELLADPLRKAEYDAQLLLENSARRSQAPRPDRAYDRRQRMREPDSPETPLTIWAFRFFVLVAVVVAAWAIQRSWQGGSFSTSPSQQLSQIRLQIESEQVSEAQRRALFARKQSLLLKHADLSQSDGAMRINDLAGRSMALLTEPMTVTLASNASINLPAVRIIFPEITLVFGSFDAAKVKEHVSRHRQRIVSELSQRLALQSAVSALSPDSDARLKSAIKDSVMMSLDIRAGETYPSTYFESPGRYGVIDVILPQSFGVVK